MRSGWNILIAILCAVVVCHCILPTAWVCDDSYISLRVADNFLNGYGLRWNVVERVQVFSHPLWLFVVFLSHATFKKSILSLTIPGIICTFFTVYALCRFLKDEAAVVLAVVLLLASRSFIDFSTSGLENPLSHLLLILFWVAAYRGRTATAFLLTGLLLLNRMDSLFLILPGMLFLLWSKRGTGVSKAFLWGMAPFIAWLLFATIYYGTPLPNTYYAKLGASIPLGDYMQQGITYYADIWATEPVLILTIAAGFAAGFFAGGQAMFISAGMLLHCLYVLSVGGDFMSSRFLTPDFFAGVVNLSIMVAGRVSALPVPVKRAFGIAGPIAALICISMFDIHTLNDAADKVRPSGVADERAVYFNTCGLIEQAKNGFEAQYLWADQGRALRTAGSRDPVCFSNIGFSGYYSGPRVYIFDTLALSDAFMARLPVQYPWRIGHMSRLPPVGYYESVLDGVNRIKSARSAALLDDIFLMTRAPLWSFKRWQAIYRANRFHALNDIYMLKPGEQISYIDPYIVYYNWCADDWPEKWSLGKLSKIYFRIQDKAAFNGTIVLSLSTWGMQTVDVWLNDNPLGSWVLEGKDLELRINSPPRAFTG